MICPGPVDTQIYNNRLGSVNFNAFSPNSSKTLFVYIHSHTRTIGTRVERDFVNDSKKAGVFNFSSAARCAELFVVAIANEVSEAWLCKQPILAFTFIHSYLHFMAFGIWNRFLEKNEKAMKNLYL